MYRRFGKRLFDIGLASFGLAVFSIPLAAIALTSWLVMGRPVLFAQDRVGRNGRLFRIKKFRTMRLGSEKDGSVTTADDRRVTRWGRSLRRWKLDELPQLWNVLVGEMSFVGPRPDVPGYADKLQGEARRILSIRPGITGPATLAFRHEEEELARAENPLRFNDEVLFPRKVELNLEYLRGISLRNDLRYIWLTISNG
jgi:lipopolysaccharide/colanic/teichoic acid biosynthesis glycosyltransferase